MLVEFVTSPAGPLLSTGFHFKADSIIDTGNAESIQVCLSTVDLVYSERDYSEYPLIVNGFLRTDR
jgi:hypothetical protein